MSRLRHKNTKTHPKHPPITPDISKTPPKHPREASPVPQKALTLSGIVDERKPLAQGGDG
jgi:hypothetical protein